MRILLNFWTKDAKRPILRYGTNPRVLGHKLASLKWEKAFLRVTYSGEYFNKKDLQQ